METLIYIYINKYEESRKQKHEAKCLIVVLCLRGEDRGILIGHISIIVVESEEYVA